MNTEIKYPNLLAGFPDSIVEEAIEAASTSTDHFKQWMLEECHEYAIGLLELYHKYAMTNQLKVAYNLSKLENLEKLRESEKGNNDNETVAKIDE
jgi:hypothetical protein